MKIPNEVVPRTQSTSQGLGYAADSSGLAVKGWQEAFNALGNLGTAIQGRRDSGERFDALGKLTDFESRYTEMQQKVNQETDPNDTTYLQRSETMFDNFQRDTMASIPDNLKPEFEYRFKTLRASAMENAIKFKYGLDDYRYRKGIDTVFQKAKNDLALDYSEENLKNFTATVYESIDASNLPQVDKDKLKYDTATALASVGYAKAYEKDLRERKDPTQVGAAVATGTSDTGAVTKSGGSDDSRGKQLAFVLHELGTTETKAGTMLKSATTLEQAVDAGLAYERAGIPARGNRLANARAVLAGKASKEALAARAYFESKGLTPVQASGMVGTLMGESGSRLDPGALNKDDGGPGDHSVGIAQWNADRKRAMLKFTGESGPVDMPAVDFAGDYSPMFADIPLEKRLAIKQSVETDVRQADALSAADAKAKYNTWFDDIKTKTYDGIVNGADLEDLLHSGAFKDFSDFKAAKEIFDQRTKVSETLKSAGDKLSKGEPLDGAVGGEGDALLKAEGGFSKLWSGDEAYATMLAKRKGGFSPDARRAVTSMLMGNDNAKALFAMKALINLKESDNLADYNALPDNVRDQVSAFYALRGSMGDQELMSALRGEDSTDPVVRQQMATFRDRAEKVYNEKDFGTIAADAKLNSILRPWLGSNAELPSLPFYRGAIQDWYREAWKVNYGKFFGDKDKATAATDAMMESTWTVTSVGKKVVMRYPPEKIGLPLYITPEVMTEQAKADVTAMGYPEARSITLIDDVQTAAETDAYKGSGGKTKSPTYKVVVMDKDGILRTPAKRISFRDDPVLREKDNNRLKIVSIDAKIAELKVQLLMVKLKEARERNFRGDIGTSDASSSNEAKYLRFQINRLEQEKASLAGPAEPTPPAKLSGTGEQPTAPMVIPPPAKPAPEVKAPEKLSDIPKKDIDEARKLFGLDPKTPDEEVIKMMLSFGKN